MGQFPRRSWGRFRAETRRRRVARLVVLFLRVSAPRREIASVIASRSYCFTPARETAKSVPNRGCLSVKGGRAGMPGLRLLLITDH